MVGFVSSPAERESFDPAAVPIRPAATVMLIRDALKGGLEVVMLRRTLGAVFGPGFYVFPGGRVDDLDEAPDAADHCVGLTDTAASQVLGLPAGGLAFWIAAIRECFEEAGVLLATSGDGPVRFDDPSVAARFSGYRQRVHRGELSIAEFCRGENLELRTDSIHYLSHWITPIGEPRRFDTRFFLAASPVGQEPLHDDAETIESVWLAPSVALVRQASGEMEMMPPTVASLRFLDRFTDVPSAIAAVARQG
jgi:8-oxo-dGTP pyrophosphatase MutT (NUDIX family)